MSDLDDYGKLSLALGRAGLVLLALYVLVLFALNRPWALALAIICVIPGFLAWTIALTTDLAARFRRKTPTATVNRGSCLGCLSVIAILVLLVLHYAASIDT